MPSRAMTPQLGATLMAVVIFLIAAGLTEGFVTPWDLPTGAAIAVGALLAGGFWSMVVWRGGLESLAGGMPGHLTSRCCLQTAC